MWSAFRYAIEYAWGPNCMVVVGTVVLGYAFLRMMKKQPQGLPPQATTALPFLGSTVELFTKQWHRIHEWFLEESLRQGGKAWQLTALGRPPAIVLTQESHFEDVLKTQFDIFEKGPKTRSFIKDFFGENGIFALDGAAWRHQRKTASHLFSHHMMKEIMETVIIEDTEIVLEKLQSATVQGSKVEVKLLMDALTTDVFTRIGFGVRLGCLRGDSSNSEFDGEFHRAFSRCPKVIQARAQQPVSLWKLKRWLGVGAEKQLMIDMKRINGAVFKVIEQCMRCKHGETPKEQDLITLFIAKGGDEANVTPQLIRDMALNFIAAGRGTTGQSLAWFLVMMSRHQDVYERVLEEMNEKMPGFVGSRQVPSMDKVASLTFLEAAIKESLRLNPAAPMNAREAMQDAVLSDGTFIPKGTRVIIPTYATARFSWMWGDDACEYRPERWLDDDGKLKQISPFKFLVFHAGPRMCLGVKLAMLEMKIVLAAIVANFKVELERDAHEITYDMSLSLPIKGELFARIYPVPTKHSEKLDGSAACVA